MEATTPWSVKGSYFEVCNCEAICPCRRQGATQGGRPTYETCDFALSWWIRQGRRGTVELADTRVVMVGVWKTTPGDPWHVTLYVDDRTTPDQHEALSAIFLGRAGGYPAKSYAPGIVEVHAVKTARIDLDHTRSEEKIDVAPFLTVRTREPVAHDFAVSCGIPGHDQPGQELRADVFRYQDTPYDWEFRGKCGFATEFAYSS
jgi:hypothetical protein